jgi:hypothetical protein
MAFFPRNKPEGIVWRMDEGECLVAVARPDGSFFLGVGRLVDGGFDTDEEPDTPTYATHPERIRNYPRNDVLSLRIERLDAILGNVVEGVLRGRVASDTSPASILNRARELVNRIFGFIH